MSDHPIEDARGGSPPPLPAMPFPGPHAGLVFAAPDPVAIRQAHIRHERQLKSVGALYGFFALLFFAAGVLGLFVGMGRAAGPAFGMVILLPFAALFGVMAYGYRTLKPWVKIAGTALAALGLLGIPVGTLISGYILYLIWCAEGQRVLQDDYADIIRATPQVRYRPTVGDKIALVLFILMFVALAALIFL